MSPSNDTPAPGTDPVATAEEEENRLATEVGEEIDPLRFGRHDDSQATELGEFLRALSSEDEQRKYRLKLIKEFYDNPTLLGAHADVVPTSSTRSEIEQRKKQVKHRIELLKSILTLLEAEMKMLDDAQPMEETSQDTPVTGT